MRGEPVMKLERRPWESVEKASEVRDREEDEKVGPCEDTEKVLEKGLGKSWAWPGHLDPLFGSVWVEGWALGPFRKGPPFI